MFKLENRISAQVLRRIRSRRAAESTNAAADIPSRGPIRLREVEFADCFAVSALKIRHKLSRDSPANWQRLWNNNPVIKDSGHIPKGWVLEGNEGIVGYLGNIPLRGFYRGTTLKIATTHALVVQPGYRFCAGGLVAAYFSQSGVDLLVSTSTIESAGNIYQAFKGQPLPQVDYDTVLFWVIDAHGFLAGMRKQLEIKGAMATIGMHVGSWVLHAERALHRRYPVKGAQVGKIDVLAPSAINDDFDAFWRKNVAATTQLITDRSAEALRWHFDVPGDQRRPVVLRYDHGGRMAGYVVVLTNATEAGLRKALIADMLVEREDPFVAQQLLIAAFEYARETRHDVLELSGFPRTIRRVCSQWNPYVRRLPSSPYLFKAINRDLHMSLGSEDAWYATPYDGDATLMPQLDGQITSAAADRYQNVMSDVTARNA